MGRARGHRLLDRRHPDRLIALPHASTATLHRDRVSPGRAWTRSGQAGLGGDGPRAAPPKAAEHGPRGGSSINGDGFDDVLITRGTYLLWYPALGRDGYGPGQRVPLPTTEEQGPTFLFAGRAGSLFLADMTGDGLSDLVHVTHRRVAYWPNLGHGQFGAQVIMGNCPEIERHDHFHPSRIRLADLDGTGTADLLYLDADGLHVWPNQSGNSFGSKLTNECVPIPEALPTLAITDLHGTGMSTLVWSTRYQPQVAIRHTSPFGTKKPYLLEKIENGMGLEARFEHTPSTQHYLADKKAGRKWATKLPFPVQVLSKVETYDHISRVRFVSTYTYHHGHYDTVEREFRGFGMVEQRDAESFSAPVGKGLFTDLPDPVNGERPKPPVVTKSWFHTGAFFERTTLEAAFAGEYYAGDEDALELGGTILSFSAEPPSGQSLTAEERREAQRALRGQLLRTEVYAEDGSADEAHPYVVITQRYETRRLQPRQTPTAQAVFFTFPKETLTRHYERNPDDPSVVHAAAVEVDDFGGVTRAASIAYPRRGTGHSDEQATGLITLQANQFAKVISATGYRVGVPYASQTYQVHGVTVADDVLVTLGEMDDFFDADDLHYEETPSGSTEEKRLLASTRLIFRKDDLSATLAFGTIEPKAIVHQTYALAFTAGMYGTGGALDGKATTTILAEAGFVDHLSDGDYWAVSGTSTLDAAAFYLPTVVTDPFGNDTTIAWDADYDMFVESVTDELNNVVAAQHDHRLLAPWEITDPNGNRVQIAFDVLGMVVKTAVMGKTSESLGDTLTDPTTTLEYDLDRWVSDQKPAFVKTRARETHQDSGTRWLETYEYSDGSGRVVMTKVSAEPGDAPELDGNGDPVYEAGVLQFEEADPRYVGTGRTVYDNKGNVIRQYEPFFSATSDYEDDEDLVDWGVTPLFDYDPLGRLVRTDFPDGSYSTALRTPWKETMRDRNDNVEDSEWYEVRKSTHTPTPSAEDQRAATLALAHKDTPTETHLDVLGRPYQVDEMLATGAPPTLVTTKTQLDIQGNPLAVVDALLRDAMTYVFGMAGQVLKQTSIDSGTRWMVQAVDGQPVRRWDQRDQTLRTVYDELRRPTELHLTVDTEDEILVEQTVYGEGETDPEDNNLRGKVYQQYDGAGRVTLESYDFKGNLLSSSRQLATTYTSQPDWGSATLESETFTTTTEYDALNRPTSVTTPDASETLIGYNDAGLLETLDVKIRGSSTETPFIRSIEYNEKGQRTLAKFGDDGMSGHHTETSYLYDDLTFRLRRIKTKQISSGDDTQNLFYTFDPIGNIVEVTDTAQQTFFFDNAVITPTQWFEYDALYRLTYAKGREHKGLVADVQRDHQEIGLNELPHANQTDAVREYEEHYEYDAVGNLLEMYHEAGPSSSASWRRWYDYGPFTASVPNTNRLRSTSLSGDTQATVPYSATYSHDLHGSITAMPHLASIAYNFRDQMSEADKGGGGTVYFTYDASGQRVRKVWEHSGLREERIYVSPLYELYRKTIISTESLDTERETLHVMDGAKRVAMVETLTWEGETELTTPTPMLRLQFDDHLGTACVETDGDGAVFSYEAFHPFGTTAYRSADSGYDVSAKRYRHTGKERDEETSLDYHGLRYRVPWLGRWSTADPMGLVDGPNLYAYARDNPIALSDPSGGTVGGGQTSNEIRIPRAPEGLPAGIPKFAFTPGGGITLTQNPEEFEGLTKGTRVYVIDPAADTDKGRGALLRLETEIVLERTARNLREAFEEAGGGAGDPHGKSKVAGQESTALDETTLHTGAIGNQEGTTSEHGVSGGVPNGTGQAKDASPLGQIGYVATTILGSILGGGILGAIVKKAGGKKAAQKVATEAVEGVAEKATKEAAETGAEKAAPQAARAGKVGDFSVVDWSGYPSGLQKPSGPFRLLEGAEYDAARKAANQANTALRAADPAKYAGKQIHEIHPVKYGGSPTDPANKIELTPAEHAKYTTFWNRLMRNLQ